MPTPITKETILIKTAKLILPYSRQHKLFIKLTPTCIALFNFIFLLICSFSKKMVKQHRLLSSITSTLIWSSMIRFFYFISRERYFPHSISLQIHQSLKNSLFLGTRIEHYRSNPFPRKTEDQKLRSIINSKYSFKKIIHPMSYIF